MRARWRAGLGDVTWAGVSLIAAASAQSRPTWPELRVQLRSSDAAQVAWAAHHVAEGRLRQAGPELASALQRFSERERSEGETQLVLALLDAVVRSGAKLPAEALTRWAGVPDCAAVLLAYATREPAAMAPAVRSILDTHPDETTWLAACNLLLSSDPRSLVPWLVSKASVEVEIEVLTISAAPETISGNISYRKPDRPAALDGFPPIPRYQVLPSGLPADPTGDEDHVPLDGPIPVSIVRRSQAQPKRGEFMTGGGFPTGASGRRVDYALQCLDRMVPRRDGAPLLSSQVRRCHVWRDQDTWQAQLVVPTLALRDRWHQIVDWLTAQRMVDATQAATLRASFHIEVSDQRVDRSKPLPEIK